MRWIAAAVIAAVVAWSGAVEAATDERRVALVIGNSAYEHAPALANPRNDAEAIAAAFERLDFEVVKGFDLDNNQMRETIHTFARSLSRADVAAFYYAGHGIQVDGRNFLIPVDAKLQHEADLAFNAVDAKLIIDQMMRESDVKLIMLDACRDNPLAQTLASSVAPSRSAAIGRGLAKIENVQGTLIAFATEPGNVAYDGEGPHSPFTEALLKHIETPEAEINLVMTRVRGEVYRKTREKQLPWVNVSLTDEFYLNGAPRSLAATEATIPAEAIGTAEASQPAAETAQPVQVAKVEPRATADDAAPTTGRTMQDWEIEKALWDAVDAGGSLAEYQAYLAEFPDGRFAGVARARIAQLSATEATADGEKRGQNTTAANVPALKLTPAATATATDTGTEVANVTPEPVVEPIDPEATEAELGLSRSDQRMVQQRLKLIGHDPRGVDGIFGPNTRAAISEWQDANDLRASGYLDEDQHATLLEESEGEYKQWLAAVERDRRQREAAAREEAKRQAAAAETRRKQQATRSAKAKAKAKAAPKKTTRKKQVASSPPPAQVQEAPVQRRQVRTIKHGERVYIQEVPEEVIIRRRRQQRTGHAIGTAAGIAAGIAIIGGFGR